MTMMNNMTNKGDRYSVRTVQFWVTIKYSESELTWRELLLINNRIVGDDTNPNSKPSKSFPAGSVT